MDIWNELWHKVFLKITLKACLSQCQSAKDLDKWLKRLNHFLIQNVLFLLFQILDQSRKRLNAVIQERNRVLDLVCHAVSSVTSGRASRNNSGSRHRNNQPNTSMSFGANGLGYSQQISQNMQQLQGNGGMRTSPASEMERLGTPPTDPLGPYTPEAAAAMEQAREARQRSMALRREIKDAIDNTKRLRDTAHTAVNSGLNKKVAETVTLKVRKVPGSNPGHARACIFYFSTTTQER